MYRVNQNNTRSHVHAMSVSSLGDDEGKVYGALVTRAGVPSTGCRKRKGLKGQVEAKP